MQKPHNNKTNRVDQIAAVAAYSVLVVSSAYGFRSILEALPETVAYFMTGIVMGSLVYIIYKNK